MCVCVCRGVCVYVCWVGQNNICISGIFGREITEHIVVYGVYIVYTVLINPMCVRTCVYVCM